VRIAPPGVGVHCVERRPGFDWRLSGRLRAYFRQEGVDVVHAHQYAPFFYSSLARYRGGPAIAFTEHGRTYPDRRRIKRVIANRFLLHRADALVGVGDAVRRALIDNEGFPPGRVEVIRNGIDVDRFAATSAERAEKRRELGWDSDQVIVLHVARLDPLKDHATALRAFAEVRKSTPHARLVIVGDGPERRAIEELTASLGLSDVVLLLGVRHDVASLWGAADVGLLTSLSEGIPLTLLEAMAAGLPTVGTRVGGVPEVVVDSECGRLCAAGDVRSLADALSTLAADPELRRRWGAAGRARVAECFSLDRMTDEYDRLYARLAARHE
jgi:L-malate glycosyltransferase